jgi:hypothetical protein
VDRHTTSVLRAPPWFSRIAALIERLPEFMATRSSAPAADSRRLFRRRP